MKQNFSIGIVGSGKMGEVMIKGIVRGEVTSPELIIATGPRDERGVELRDRYKIHTSTSNLAVVEADVVILAIRPLHLAAVLEQLRGKIPKSSAILSIVTAKPIAMIARWLHSTNIVRAALNTPCAIGKGVIEWTSQSTISEQAIRPVVSIFNALGKHYPVSDEDSVDRGTVCEGTGSAMVYYGAECLIDGAVRIGASRHAAERRTLEMMQGTIEYALSQLGEKSVTDLRHEVTSPGGTTCAAVYELDRGGSRVAVADAMKAAHKCVKELRK